MIYNGRKEIVCKKVVQADLKVEQKAGPAFGGLAPKPFWFS